MKVLFVLLITFGLLTSASATEFRHATVEEGQAALLGDDAWYEALGAAEIALRLESARPDKTIEDLKAAYAKAVLPWSQEEMDQDIEFLAPYAAALSQYADLLPDDVLLVKISHEIEGGFPHTRGNAIFVPAAFSQVGPELFYHEVFHVLSRHQQTLHREPYQILGFETCELIETPALKTRRLTNPDVPLRAPWIKGADRAIAPWMSMNRPAYDPDLGGFGQHFSFGMLEVKVLGDRCDAKMNGKGEPSILTPGAAPEYFDAIGSNTGYVIHPEEVLADNFVFLMTGKQDLPNPEIVEALGKWLKDSQ